MSVNEQMETEDSNHTLRLTQNYHMINTAFEVLVRMDKNAKLLQALNLIYIFLNNQLGLQRDTWQHLA